MIRNHLTESSSYWREQVEERRGLLARLQNDLIEAEAKLAEKLAAINAFEFKLRAKIEPYVRQLEAIEAEIKAQFKRLEQEWDNLEGDEGDNPWRLDEEGAAASGEYRYHDEVSKEAPQKLDADQKAEIKQLYRQLARRFHPDMAVDEQDRAYRTQMMTAINAAYTMGDLAKLWELALEPDAANHIDYAKTDEQLSEALLQEIGRVERRLEEITRELTQLDHHHSVRLMRKAEQARAEGRDFFTELIGDIKEKIFQKTMDLEWLKSEEAQTEGLFSEEHDFGDGLLGIDEWSDRWQIKIKNYGLYDDDILDDSD